MTENAYIVDINSANFQQLVIDGSHTKPVLIEFWANNYEPCQTMTPILAKIAESYQGELVLARVDCEVEREVVMQFGVRSLPTVVLFKDGQPLDGFTGEQSEEAILQILAKHIAPPPAAEEDKFELANTLYLQGQKAEAEAQLKALLAEDNGHMPALILYARCMAERGELAEAETILGAVTGDTYKQALAAAKAQLTFLKQAKDLPTLSELQEKSIKNPEDPEAAYQLAIVQLANQQYEIALEGLLALFKNHRGYENGLAHKTLLQLFDLLGNSDPLVTVYRKKLYQVLY